MCIAVAAAAALCHGDGGVVGQVGNDKAALGVLDDRAQRHLDDEVLGVFAVAQARAALAALRGHILALVAEIHQGGQVVVHHKDNVAAAAAVAAVRAACCHEFFAVKAHRAVAALARVEPDGGDVDKVGLCCHTGPPYQPLRFAFPHAGRRDREVIAFTQITQKRAGPQGSGSSGCSFSGRSYCFTLHFLPLLPTRSKRTVPSTRANRVSSLPLPTFSPG